MKHELDLLNNSVSFFREAVKYAEKSEGDGSNWKFAIINLVQAMELALKEALRRIHPSFVYEDIDVAKPDKTVSITKAITRLKSHHIGGEAISEAESEKFTAAIKLRNQFAHFDCSYNAEYVEAKFAGIFAFMLFFYEDHLSVDRDEIIDQEQYSAIFSLKEAKEELLSKVRAQIAMHNLKPIWLCPDCLEDTFIVEEERCRLCGYAEKLQQCNNCGERIFEFELKDISELFDASVEDGRLVIYDRYGYDGGACLNCIDGVKEDVKNKRFEKFVSEMEEDVHFRRGRPF
jgi:hypothetical protein